ncbi:MAG: hypothetical protein A2413_15505 [Treponema sp. RIFOXYC1_FULL_61_9]|nr:MAG: hypothetical protein A2413_15505 [Treponema sp. RIFOXYC1_FULL_61_9]
MLAERSFDRFLFELHTFIQFIAAFLLAFPHDTRPPGDSMTESQDHAGFAGNGDADVIRKILRTFEGYQSIETDRIVRVNQLPKGGMQHNSLPRNTVNPIGNGIARAAELP